MLPNMFCGVYVLLFVLVIAILMGINFFLQLTEIPSKVTIFYVDRGDLYEKKIIDLMFKGRDVHVLYDRVYGHAYMSVWLADKIGLDDLHETCEADWSFPSGLALEFRIQKEELISLIESYEIEVKIEDSFLL